MKINNMEQISYENKYLNTLEVKNKESESKQMNRDILDLSNDRNDYTGIYNKNGKVDSINSFSFNSTLDKGTAIGTTVMVNRGAFDSIVSYSTDNEPKWDELGCDGDKRWVVINGQRFEVEHSPEEKALRKRAMRSLVEIMNDYDIERKKESMKNDNNNKDTLKENTKVVDVLKRVFGLESFSDIWNMIT